MPLVFSFQVVVVIFNSSDRCDCQISFVVGSKTLPDIQCVTVDNGFNYLLHDDYQLRWYDDGGGNGDGGNGDGGDGD